MLEYNCEKTCKPEKCKNKKCCVDLILTILISALTLTIGIIIGNALAATLILQPAIIISIILLKTNAIYEYFALEIGKLN